MKPAINIIRTKNSVCLFPYISQGFDIGDPDIYDAKTFSKFFIEIAIPQNPKNVAGIILHNLQEISFGWNRMSFREGVIDVLEIAFVEAEKIDAEFPSVFDWPGKIKKI